MSRAALYSILLISLIFPVNGYCYINPAAGSLIIQVFFAGVFSAILAIKIFWGKIKQLFLKILPHKK
ncbi:MAG: hypothetical protein A3J83_03760 [Elusimicrobia bacterium RIFOXYA2_FULL_40_6]|nr:MAG: hypothetical protein A3J83_03760 [Elusimicrobia bacterium RIFOXYA2_FULL_40_6]